jgi:hypothetical protein
VGERVGLVLALLVGKVDLQNGVAGRDDERDLSVERTLEAERPPGRQVLDDGWEPIEPLAPLRLLPPPGEAVRKLDQARAPTVSAASWATSVGVVPTRTPQASSASFFACAVPAVPEMIAPACPIVLPGGAVKPAM